MRLCGENAYASRRGRRCIEVFCGCLQTNENRWNKKTVLPRHWPCGWLEGAKAGWVMRCFGSKTVIEPTESTKPTNK